MPEAPKKAEEPALAELVALLNVHAAFIEQLCSAAGGTPWECEAKRFRWHLARSAVSRFRSGTPTWEEVQEYLATLHLEDFALACGCADGAEAAWNFFVREYRGYLRKCAGVMLRHSAESPEARELADSLFAELYGVADGRRGAGSLFRYFHGRSSLKTWLRAVLAQRHVDGIRAAQRFDSLDEEDGGAQLSAPDGAGGGKVLKHFDVRERGPLATPADPHRAEYVALFCEALRRALETLDTEDRRRICLYYAEGQTLAEVGRRCGEHESSASRNLERIRKDLKTRVEEDLRGGLRSDGKADGAAQGGLSEAQISLCVQYATEDAPIDLDLLFPGEVGGVREGLTGKNSTLRRRAEGRES
jgi:RNA polymerase sigma factor (sigma-70 family)